MTIGLVGHYLDTKMGIGVFLDRLLEPLMAGLAERGVEGKVIASPNALMRTPAMQRLKQRSDQQVTALAPLDYSPIKRFGWIATKFSGYCKEEGIDQIVWLSNPMVLPYHPPSVAVLHDVNEWKDSEKYGSYLKTQMRSWMYLEASLKWAEEIVCISEETTNDLLHFRPNTTAKINTIPNGFDSPLASLTPAEIDVPDAPFLLSVGRIDPKGKRLPEAVELVRALRDRSGVPWELHLTGGMNESTRKAGEAFLQDIESIPWVQYQGYVEDATLAAWYKHATAVVFLSENEGFGTPVAEGPEFERRVIINKKNLASFGAGGDAVIVVDPQDQPAAAATVLEKLAVERVVPEAPPSEVYTYADAAARYAEELSRWVKS